MELQATSLGAARPAVNPKALHQERRRMLTHCGVGLGDEGAWLDEDDGEAARWTTFGDASLL